MSLLLIFASSKIYTISLKCGTCQKTTGCLGNKCMIFSGDITAEYCNGNSVCSFSLQENIQIGTCSTDMSGSGCSSGVCMMGASVNMCYASGGGCLNGVTFS
jgi:hypothetical protein